jgi:two-component system OmpR family sensor kinase
LAEHKQIDPGLESVQTVPLLVIGERAAMIVLLANLIDNAIRYTHRGGKIDVLIGRQDN